MRTPRLEWMMQYKSRLHCRALRSVSQYCIISSQTSLLRRLFYEAKFFLYIIEANTSINHGNIKSLTPETFIIVYSTAGRLNTIAPFRSPPHWVSKPAVHEVNNLTDLIGARIGTTESHAVCTAYIALARLYIANSYRCILSVNTTTIPSCISGSQQNQFTHAVVLK